MGSINIPVKTQQKYEQVITHENIKAAHWLFIQTEDYEDEGRTGTQTDPGCNPKPDVLLIQE